MMRLLLLLASLASSQGYTSVRYPLTSQGQTIACPTCITTLTPNGVSSIAATSPIVVSGSTGTVTVSCPTCGASADSARIAGLSDSAKALVRYARTAALHDTADALRAYARARIRDSLSTLATIARSGSASDLVTGTLPDYCLPNLVAPGAFGDSSHVAQVATDMKGRITGIANIAITPTSIGALPAAGGTANAMAKWTSSSVLGTGSWTDSTSVSRTTTTDTLVVQHAQIADIPGTAGGAVVFGYKGLNALGYPTGFLAQYNGNLAIAARGVGSSIASVAASQISQSVATQTATLTAGGFSVQGMSSTTDTITSLSAGGIAKAVAGSGAITLATDADLGKIYKSAQIRSLNGPFSAVSALPSVVTIPANILSVDRILHIKMTGALAGTGTSAFTLIWDGAYSETLYATIYSGYWKLDILLGVQSLGSPTLLDVNSTCLVGTHSPTVWSNVVASWSMSPTATHTLDVQLNGGASGDAFSTLMSSVEIL